MLRQARFLYETNLLINSKIVLGDVFLSTSSLIYLNKFKDSCVLNQMSTNRGRWILSALDNSGCATSSTFKLKPTCIRKKYNKTRNVWFECMADFPKKLEEILASDYSLDFTEKWTRNCHKTSLGENVLGDELEHCYFLWFHTCFV